MGKSAREFIDFLEKSNQSVWQILPICPTSYGDSPYQSFSTYAGNPYFIDFDELFKEDLLKKEEYENIKWNETDDFVEYSLIYENRFKVLKLATERALDKKCDEIETFIEENSFWLENYASFMAIKNHFAGVSWQDWDAAIKLRKEKELDELNDNLSDDIIFWKTVQFLFFDQWGKLKKYANEKNVLIIGDLPIYVALDSADVWANPELFQLDENLTPTKVAGCPPDAFSADGQLWGNPLYNWEQMAKDNYSWWIKRIEFQCKIYDTLRIDHFRGFDAYYAIPYEDKTAVNGSWKQGPSKDLFVAIENSIGRQSIIAEDLGFLTQSVHELLEFTGYPGMKVLQFAFDNMDNQNAYIPHTYNENCIAYIGTHDNTTIKDWFEDEDVKNDAENAKQYFALTQEEGYNWGMMRGLWSCKADLTVVQMQDILNLDKSARMNTPSTLGGNWGWRMANDVLTDLLAEKLALKMKLYSRK